MQARPASTTSTPPSRLAALLRKALLLAAALAISPSFAAQGSTVIDPSGFVRTAAGQDDKPAKPTAAAGAKKAKDGKAAVDSKGKTASPAKDASGKKDKAGKKSAKKAPEQKPGPLADFGQEAAPEDVVHVANWVSYTRNHKKKAFVLIDKKMARLYVFDPQGKLKSSTPILLGKAIGDYVAPGSGNKPLSQLKEEEKTTPAGRFLAAPGRNTSGEDIIWIDYDAAVSMHRMRKVSAEERRAERMATPEVADNRISNGCVNVPHKFYNSVLKPTVMRHGAFVYVLPETKSPQQQFGSYDVKAAASKA